MFRDPNNNIYIAGYNNCNSSDEDYLTLKYCPPAPVQPGAITGSSTVCGGSSQTYTISPVTGAISYIWTLPTGATGTSTTNSITVNFGTSAVSGNITVKGHNDCNDGASSTLPIVVNAKPNTPIVTSNNNILQSSSTTGNQWYNQSGAIAGAITQNYTPSSSGDYYVIVTIIGCSSNSSNTMHFIPTGISPIEFAKSMKAYPNPVTNELTIELEGNTTKTNFEILNSLGQVVFSGNLIEKTIVQTASFASGVYMIKLKSGKSFEFKKIIKN